MRKMFRRFVPIFLAFTIASPMSVFAEFSEQDEKDFEKGIYKLYMLMEAIDEGYYGDFTMDDLFDGVYKGLFSNLDPYSRYMDKTEMDEMKKFINAMGEGLGVMFIPTEKGYAIYQVEDNSPAKAAGVLPGDIIVTVGGQSVLVLTVEEFGQAITDSLGKEFKFTVLRGDKKIDLKATPGSYKAKTAYTLSMSEVLSDAEILKNTEKMSVVRITQFSEGTSKEFKEVVSNLRMRGISRIILDLRGNGGGIVDEAIDICKQVVPEGVIMTQVDHIGKKVYRSELKTPPFEQIVVLVDGNTASAAEIVASALQDSGSKVVGSTSFGKGVIQAGFEIPDGTGFNVTIGEYLRRSGKNLHGIGIIPDYAFEYIPYIPFVFDKSAQDADYVKNVKNVLSRLGYKMDKTKNTYTLEDVEIIKAIQAESGIEATGEVTVETVNRLNNMLFDSYISGAPDFTKALELLHAK